MVLSLCSHLILLLSFRRGDHLIIEYAAQLFHKRIEVLHEDPDLNLVFGPDFVSRITLGHVHDNHFVALAPSSVLGEVRPRFLVV